MGEVRNILFVMCDQLRWDYLSCYSHPHLRTPNIDWLASRGVRFDKAYTQSPVCGPSRMSFYTGRYVISHGSTWNDFPLRVGELTLGDHLRPLGVDTVLVGKTHMKADREGMERYGIPEGTVIGARLAECGFDAFERDDGLHPDGDYRPDPPYNDHLRSRGYAPQNPWQTHANSVEPRGEGETGLGWFLKYSNRPARVAEPDSETPYLTRRFMDFVEGRKDDTPWLCHLSYIKPHWPYIVPAPYNDMHGPDTWLPAVRSEAERTDPHPVYREFMATRASRAFSQDEVRETVLAGYMGLVKQLDDQMGRLLTFMARCGLLENTMVVFTSDHGDYLGDHWLGEKDFFHDPSVRIPLIVFDPRPEADATRGTATSLLVEGIDLAPTFLDALGGKPRPHRLEGRSLCPLLRGEVPGDWRGHAFSEYDYSVLPVREALGTGTDDSRLFMVTDGRWKLVHSPQFGPMLFDLETDPDELADRGKDPGTAAVRERLRDALFEWAGRQRQRVTMGADQILGRPQATRKGIFVGYWDEKEAEIPGGG